MRQLPLPRRTRSNFFSLTVFITSYIWGPGAPSLQPLPATPSFPAIGNSVVPAFLIWTQRGTAGEKDEEKESATIVSGVILCKRCLASYISV